MHQVRLWQSQHHCESSDLLLLTQETMQTSPPTGPRFRPYASPNHHVTKGRYITSNDARGYMYVLRIRRHVALY